MARLQATSCFGVAAAALKIMGRWWRTGCHATDMSGATVAVTVGRLALRSWHRLGIVVVAGGELALGPAG